MKREMFNLNPKKVNKEDRRFLLTKSSTEILFNEQGKMHNQILIISIFAVFISIASMVLGSSFNSVNQKLFVIIFLSVLSIYLIFLFVKSYFLIKKQNKLMISSYDNLFKIHFDYAKEKQQLPINKITFLENLKRLLKWGNKWETGKMIFILTFILGLLLFMNRYNLLLNIPDKIADFCIKESVKFWQNGNLQLLRSFFEHFIFNFITPIIFVIFSLGFNKLFRQYANWRISFGIGALCSVVITLAWEFQKMPVEWIEVIYDLTAVLLSYLFINWMLKEQEIKVKQTSKKEASQQ